MRWIGEEGVYEDILNIIKRVPYTTRVARYYDIPLCFDTESTSFETEKGDKAAYCYIWMLAVGDLIVYGRYLKSFKKLCDMLSRDLKLTKDLRLLFFVNYLGHDFQFFHKYFSWTKVFARKGRDVLFSITSTNIEFRCSYLLTGYSVDEMGQKVGIEKLKGFDYRKMRNSKTRLTPEEFKYCEHDVKIMSKFLRDKAKMEGGLGRFELTKTGYTRTYIKQKTIWKRGVGRDYKKLISKLTLTPNEYQLLKKSFGGGYTHANANYSRQTLYNLESYDINSCHPSCLISNELPMEKVNVDFKNWSEFEKLTDEYACFAKLHFDGIEARLTGDHYLSESKCCTLIDGEFKKDIYGDIDNGRIVNGRNVVTCVSDVDIRIILNAYKIRGDINVLDCQFYKKQYLPKPLILSLLDMYNKKTLLKGDKEHKYEYTRFKEMFNGAYGMMVMDVAPECYAYIDGVWNKPTEIDLEKAIKKYNNDNQRVNFYAWGCYCTALSRERVWELILARPKQYVYSDTDSGKLLHDEKNMIIIEELNKLNKKKLLKMCEYYNIDFDLCQPKGYVIGDFALEKIITRFRTLGAKRYLTEGYDVENVNGEYVVSDELTTTLTCAGVNKEFGKLWLMDDAYSYQINKMKVDHFDLFDFGYEFPAEATKKLDHRYIDTPIHEYLTDYQGNVQKVKAPSGVHLSPSPYKLDENWDYQEYIETLQASCGIYEDSLEC